MMVLQSVVDDRTIGHTVAIAAAVAGAAAAHFDHAQLYNLQEKWLSVVRPTDFGEKPFQLVIAENFPASCTKTIVR